MVAALVSIMTVCGVLAVELEGTFVQGGLVTGRAQPGTQIFYNDTQVRVSANGDFVFGFGRDEGNLQHLRWVTPDGTEHRREITVESREYKIQSIKGVAQKYVSPAKEVMARISRENKMVRQARKRDDERTDYLAPFIWPTEGPITGVYGSQRIFNGEPRRPHFGLDIAGPVGQRVVAPADGIITLAHKDMYYSGGTLILDHGHGISSTFIHLSKLLVEEGDVIKQGQAIAEVGKTGRVTGPHLDWRMNWFGVRLDPQLVLPARK